MHQRHWIRLIELQAADIDLLTNLLDRVRIKLKNQDRHEDEEQLYQTICFVLSNVLQDV